MGDRDSVSWTNVRAVEWYLLIDIFSFFSSSKGYTIIPGSGRFRAFVQGLSVGTRCIYGFLLVPLWFSLVGEFMHMVSLFTMEHLQHYDVL